MNFNHPDRINQCRYANWGNNEECRNPIEGGTYLCHEHRRLVADALRIPPQPILQRANAIQIDERVYNQLRNNVNIDVGVQRIREMDNNLREAGMAAPGGWNANPLAQQPMANLEQFNQAKGV